MKQTSLVLLVALVVLLFSTPSTATKEPEVPNFNHMRVKDIKKWMRDRSLSCSACEEKKDLVAFCTEAAKTQPKPIVTQVPDVPLWDAWSANAKEVCAANESLFSDAEAANTTCSRIASAIESFFMQHGKAVALKLKKKAGALLKTSYGDIYLKAGKKLLTRIVNFCAKNLKKCSSTSKLSELFTSNGIEHVNLKDYLTNLGIENSNPMYDIVKNNKGLSGGKK